MSPSPVALGCVCELWRYPVKSLGGERLKRTTISARGVLGDRGWALRNEETGELHNAKRYPVVMRSATPGRSVRRTANVIGCGQQRRLCVD
jgi:uncharacterized protein YcbX